MCIDTRDSLVEHLQWALMVELSTIPPYLCALYSIPDGSNATSAHLIRSVVMEEMLHMTLVANLMNAIGAKPCLNKAKWVPKYPTYLPHSDDSFCVHLLPFSKKAIETFLKIERPAPADAPPQPHGFSTIGQFYEAIKEGFEIVAENDEHLFDGKPENQVTGETWYYGGGGEPIRVRDLASAKHALAEIAEQGEGLDHTIFDSDHAFFDQDEELAHYFKFKEIQLGRRYTGEDTPKSGPSGPELPVDWDAVYPMKPDPKAENYTDRPEVHALMTDFNEAYTKLLKTLHKAYNGKPHLLGEAVPEMYALKYKAQELMRIPTGDDDGTTVGPPFEFVGR